MSHIDELRRQGFDLSEYDKHIGHWRVRCSQCEAMVINGVPCHEASCPHIKQGDDDNELHA